MLTSIDWSAIEARLVAWLSGSPAAEDLLEAFRRGDDPYVTNAMAMFNVKDVTPEQRQQGKVAVLACGFGGGHKAFAAMGRNYGLKLPEADAMRAVSLWRLANPWAQPFWSSLESAYTRALRNPGKVFAAGRVSYLFDGDSLWYQLPSGRVLCYPQARFNAEGDVTYAKAAWKPAVGAKEWPRAKLWHGIACENITQACAADLLRSALRRLDAQGVAVVGHVHDEIIVEGDAQGVAEVMCTPPQWAVGLPLAVKVDTTPRYR